MCTNILQKYVKACNMFNLVYNRVGIFEHRKSDAVYGCGLRFPRQLTAEVFSFPRPATVFLKLRQLAVDGHLSNLLVWHGQTKCGNNNSSLSQLSLACRISTTSFQSPSQFKGVTLNLFLTVVQLLCFLKGAFGAATIIVYLVLGNFALDSLLESGSQVVRQGYA
ncbi:transmembrane protein, putative [Medicago truncatula]|uniref:Transmembrane protein, putative n=1 Tax=Medicago truncatula TaxID=3880 RepID=A0A072U753_MEDTR|nr:transmembrane protein, putative [Medicago truncatula]